MFNFNIVLADDRSLFDSAFRLWLEQLEEFQLIDVVKRASLLLQRIELLQPEILLLNWELPDLQLIQDKVRLIIKLKQRFPKMHIIVLSSRVALEQYLPMSVGYIFVSKSEPPETLKNALLSFYSTERQRK